MHLLSSSTTVMSAELTINGQLVVVRRIPSNAMYANGAPVPDNVVKEIYDVVDGKIQIVDTIHGKVIPAQHIPERIEFN